VKRKQNHVNDASNRAGMSSEGPPMKLKRTESNNFCGKSTDETVNEKNGQSVKGRLKLELSTYEIENPISALEKITSNDYIYQILNTCFKLMPPKSFGIHSTEEFEQNLLVQFTWNELTSSSISIRPQSVDISAQMLEQQNGNDQNILLEQKANQALWFAVQAFVLQHLPASDSSPYVDISQECRNCARMFHRLLFSVVGLNTREPNTIVDWGQIMRRFPRSELLQASRAMYYMAESILLDSKIFPYIGKHGVLAQTCCLLTFYLLVIGERAEEADIFLRSVKIYAEKEKSILHVNTSNMDDETRIKTQVKQIVVKGLLDGYNSMKASLWYNTYAPKLEDFYTLKSLEKFIKLSILSTITGNNYSKETRLLYTKQNESLKLLQAILAEGREPKIQLLNFLNTCRELRKDTSNLPEPHLVTMWKIFTYTLEVFALEITTKQFYLEEATVFSTQVTLSNEISKEWLTCLTVAMTAGARSLNLLKFVTRTHINYSARLCSEPELLQVSDSKLKEAYNMLQADIIILEALDTKYKISQFNDMVKQLKNQERIHKQVISQLEALQKRNQPSSVAVSSSTPSFLQLLSTENPDSLGMATAGTDNKTQNIDFSALIDETSQQTTMREGSPWRNSLFVNEIMNWWDGCW
jgi:hypothetical protein